MPEKTESKIIVAEELVSSIGMGEQSEPKSRIAADAGRSAATSMSQRGMLVPPDRPPPNWWSRHRRHVHRAEWAVCGIFLLLAGYFAFLLLFPGRPVPVATPPQPGREEFRRLLRSLAPINPVADWNVPSRMGRWRSIVIHHSATPGGSPESIDRFHREVRKFENGLGYHFVIGNGTGMPDGQVAIGKRWLEQLDGAHVKNTDSPNTYSIGICLVGNFNETMPTAKQLASLQGLLAFLRKDYSIGLASIVRHDAASAAATECPGQYFYLDEVVLALANPAKGDGNR